MLYSTIITFIITLAALAAPLYADAGGEAVTDTAAVTAAAAPDTAVSEADGGDALTAVTDTAATPSAAGKATVPDSAEISAARERAKAEREERLAPYGVTRAASFNGRVIGRAGMFRSDGSNMSEAMRYRSLTSVYIPFTLNSSMNRTLHYGNVANARYPMSVYSPVTTGDMMSASQAASAEFDPLDGFIYTPYPDMFKTPELHIYWENGAFSQNTLNLRISRPLSGNLMLSVFSDYNYLEGTRFNHERNDIINFYKTFRSDTSTIMNNGYNPLTEEHKLGAAITRQGADSSKFHAAFSYANLQNEYALDIEVDTADNRLHWARLDRDVIRLDAALADKKIGWLRVNFKTSFISEDRASAYAPDTSLRDINGKSGSNGFYADADAILPFGLGVRLQGMAGTFELSDGERIRYSQYYPEIIFRKSLLPQDHALGDMSLKAFIGVEVVPDPDRDSDTIRVAGPNYGAAFEYRPATWARLTLSAEDDFGLWSAGAEGEIETKYGGLLLGYQWIDNSVYVNDWQLLKGWPYLQPGNTIIIAPWTARLGGFSLLTKAMIADVKPYLKTTAAISHLVIPRGMAHSFETELGIDYWSEREPLTFAGLDCWSDPIVDVNLKVTAHIKSFRLFYKVGNVLNTRHAYIPGYFSPGLTFRWGINWFLM